MKVNVFRIDAKFAVAQSAKPLYTGELFQISSTGDTDIAIVQDSDGYLKGHTIDKLLVVEEYVVGNTKEAVEPKAAAKPATAAAAKTKAVGSKKS